ncbi:hypothetical protein DSM25558_4524 [Agrobacterium sp. DSM 25558]|nr:hypothetical protein DSM25558_4524 [Agrobacterium sp. DSM 25558]
MIYLPISHEASVAAMLSRKSYRASKNSLDK